jgi:hypothetical protein
MTETTRGLPVVHVRKVPRVQLIDHYPLCQLYSQSKQKSDFRFNC